MTGIAGPDAPMGTPQAAPPSAQGSNGKAVGGLILAIVAILAGIFGGLIIPGVIGLLAGAGAIVLGVLGRKAAAGGAGSGGMATAGLVIGILGSLLSVGTMGCTLMCGAAMHKLGNDAEFQKKIRESMEKAAKDNPDLKKAMEENPEFKKAMEDAQKKAPSNP
jgi:hypothetical protein